ncbi:hypothetical protein BJB45_15245 [Halomonas huangheensis]|uniref:Uncharacterized protein n=1 Tax=Halomonas huangheensis TaxID=1178482 RepID=W1N7U2_9GAMM|nr:hypothetical protein BJB45_15245 [Halomonas huangheensis]
MFGAQALRCNKMLGNNWGAQVPRQSVQKTRAPK